MSSSEILQDKLILAVDDEEDVLDIIEEELSESANCTLHRATTFEKAQQYLVSYTYDLVILDIMGVRGFDLLQIATNANFPVVMLTAHAFTPEALKKSIELGARRVLAQGEARFPCALFGRRPEAQLSVRVEEGARPSGDPVQQEIRFRLAEITGRILGRLRKEVVCG